ncbi:MAG: radical SAM protein [Micavibrio aeruginosavorus]|uniref:Radical SAM protein n=1 Tax=Micavibrio aeruginosavorus TaxID=349221 RepID=A0A7T5UHG5_9BACT|nr:MAG: radical SAM protein [Micavibrio aeruginosavorus]
MSRYRITVNLEWTNACNARCSMCPRHMIGQTEIMTESCFATVIKRMNSAEVFRVVIAGYGEPSIHPQFGKFSDMLRGNPVRFDMVSNGHALDIKKLRKIDGSIHLLVVSFSSIVKEVYDKTHVRLDQNRVIRNILCAAETLNKTKLAISLTPTIECLHTLPETIEWFHSRGITALTMSPTLYNRAGSLRQSQESEARLREIIRQYGLRSQEMEFIPSLWDCVKQTCSNRFHCMPRNAVVAIAANGDYQYCFNDIGRKRRMGNVRDMSLAEALKLREGTGSDPDLCAGCNIKGRYASREIAAVIRHYWSQGKSSRG